MVMNRQRYIGGISVAVAVMWVSVTMAATRVDNTETWSGGDTAGWTNTVAPSLAALNNPGGYLNLGFGSTLAPSSVEDTMYRAIGTGMLLTNLAFTFQAVDMVPSSALIKLHSAAMGHLWTLGVPVAPTGEIAVVQVPVDFAAGWFRGIDDTEAQFLTDLRSVDWVGITLLRHASTIAQNYALDDFRIRGVQFTGDADMDYMADAWEALNGLSSNDYADATLDADSDGMSNYAEFRAGSNPQLSSSRFEARVATIRAGTGVPVELRWDSVSNRWYTIWRSTNLVDGFSVLTTGEEASPPTNRYQDVTATNAPAHFYRIEVEPEF
jgi:hypothetical protein